MKDRVKRSFLLTLVFALVFTSTVGTAFGAKAKDDDWKISSKTVTEGDITTTTVTMTKEEGSSSKETKIDKYVTNNVTGKWINYSTDNYSNRSTGIEVTLESTRTKEHSRDEGVTVATLEGSYDVTQYINVSKYEDTSVTMNVRADHVKTLLNCLDGMKQNVREGAAFEETVILETKLDNVDSFTYKVPKEVLQNVASRKNSSLELKGNFGYIKLDKAGLDSMLKDLKSDLIITLKKIQRKEDVSIRVSMNNGRQITNIESDGIEMGVLYEGKYRLDPSRITAEYVDLYGNTEIIKEGVAYDQEQHVVVIPKGNVGEFDVKVAPFEFTDTKSHWAEKSIDRWSDLGIIVGYQGKFSPNANIKRCDMATIVSRLTNEDPVELDRPQQYITREEAAVLIGTAFGYAKSETCTKTFSDENAIAADAKGYLYTLVNKGYMQGYAGKLNPKSPITRAEAVTMFNNIIAELVNYGTFGKTVKGNVLVNDDGVVLKDAVVEGDVIITDGVGDGDVTLDNVEIKGTLIVRGGGENSIHINGESKIKEVDVKRTTGAVRIVSESKAVVDNLKVSDGKDSVILAGTLAKVSVASNVPVKLSELQLAELEVEAKEAKVNVESSAYIKNAVIKESAEKVALEVAGEIKALAANGASATIEGSGALHEVVAGANDVSVKTSGTKVTVNEGVTGTIAGKDKLAAGAVGSVPGNIPGKGSDGKVQQSVSVFAPTVKVDKLEDGKTYKGGKLTFDLFATSTKGKKLSHNSCQVTLNGNAVKKTWDDEEKTSYTLNFEPGKNIVVVQATDDGETTKKTYTVNYESGTYEAVVAIELFTLGEGYLIPPTTVQVEDGESAKSVLLRLLSENGYTADVDDKGTNFYMASIQGGKINDLPMTLDNAPEYITDALKKTGFELGERTEKDELGEFDYTNGSGWMYTVGNSFPNVGFGEYYLQEGDVMRIQYTLAYGADIGSTMVTSLFWDVANRDAITKKYADKSIPDSVLEKIQRLDAKSI